MQSKTEPRSQTLRARVSPWAIAAATLFAAGPLVAVRAEPAPAPAAASGPDAATSGDAPGASSTSTVSTDENEIVVTATRRRETIQDIPINVSAITGESISAQGLVNLSDLTRVTPGLAMSDQGGRDANLLTVRGLNAVSLGASEFLGTDGGGTIAQYVGDVPLFADLHLLDLERVEILLGPQGTLYGAGTLGGAIRYIPNRPKFGDSSLTVETGAYMIAHSGNLGTESSLTGNLSLGASTAVRATIGYARLPGFIDQPRLIRVPGESIPDPELANPTADVAANLRNQEDVNRGDLISGRFAVRQGFGDKIDANLTYYYQKQRAGGRTINHQDAFGTGQYENAHRYTEPNTRRTQLGTLELKLDLGFAEATSATGYSDHDEKGRRDQTDLILDFEYGYEDFPAFSAFTNEWVDEQRLSQELRLVSQGDSKLQWIVGGFYNNLRHDDFTAEFVPGIPEFFGVDRPDNLEYFQPIKSRLREVAGFGEVGYDFTEQWNVTIGARYFDFRDRQSTGFALPLIDGSDPDEILIDPDSITVKDDDTIFKANTSYKFTQDLLGYATLSEGYRVGGGNPVPLCPDPIPPEQNVCATADERQFDPDTTLNHEIGIHSKWFGGRLTVNGDVYYIRWKDAQVGSITANGQVPITINADKAVSQGVELAISGVIDSHWSATLTYAFVDAKLKADAPNILRTSPLGESVTIFGDAEDGDRLPGSPKHQGNASVTWTNPLPDNLTFDATYGIFAQSDVLTTAGRRRPIVPEPVPGEPPGPDEPPLTETARDNERLGGYAVHYASATIRTDDWTLRLWAKNLFDKYAETGVRTDSNYIGPITGNDGPDQHDFRLRRYFHSMIAPMSVGLTYTYRFR